MRFNDGTSVWFGWDGNRLVEELPSSGAPVRLRCAGQRPRPWYNFWAPAAKQGDGSDFVIEGKQYITDKQGHLYYGTMSGTPSNPTVHGGDYVPAAPKR